MALIRKQDAAAPPAEKRRSERTGETLLQQLHDDRPMARRWAARDLVDYPHADAALAERLLMEQDLSVREVILTSLTRLGSPVAIHALLACLRSQDASLRNEAIVCMQQLPAEVAPIMQQLLTCDDADLRIFAVNILGALCHPQVEAWLIQVLQQDCHVNVCAAALDLLAEVGTRQALSAIGLVRQRFAEQPYIQFAADLALKRINESGAPDGKHAD